MSVWGLTLGRNSAKSSGVSCSTTDAQRIKLDVRPEANGRCLRRVVTRAQYLAAELKL
jgi:hypothetical protein